MTEPLTPIEALANLSYAWEKSFAVLKPPIAIAGVFLAGLSVAFDYPEWAQAVLRDAVDEGLIDPSKLAFFIQGLPLEVQS